jgi:hypothetical protein
LEQRPPPATLAIRALALVEPGPGAVLIIAVIAYAGIAGDKVNLLVCRARARYVEPLAGVRMAELVACLGATSDHERKQHHDHWVDPFPHAPSRTSSILPNRVEPYDLFQARELTDPAHHTNLAP